MLIGHIVRAVTAFHEAVTGEKAQETGPDPMQAAYGDASLLTRFVPQETPSASPQSAVPPEILRLHM